MLPGVGVFGTSLTARVIIPLLKNEGFAVKALWGRTQEEAEELAKEMNVPFYTNRIDDVLLHQDVDLVCINLPPPLTRQIAVKTLGKCCCCCICMGGWMDGCCGPGGVGADVEGVRRSFLSLQGAFGSLWSGVEGGSVRCKPEVLLRKVPASCCSTGSKVSSLFHQDRFNFAAVGLT